MKDQSPLSAGEIREAFDKARAETREKLENSGAGPILAYLSEAVSALQAGGADVTLFARNGDHTNAYDMMYTCSGGGSGTVKAYGVIKSGAAEHLWAIASEHDKKPVSRLYISLHNASCEGGRISTDNGASNSRTTIRSDCYDFGTDPEALKKMQQRLIDICAGNAAVMDYDTQGVFNKTAPDPVISKPSPKLKL